MHRCQEPAGRYRVEFSYLESDGSPREEEYIAPVGPHQNIYRHSKTKDVVECDGPPMDAAGNPDPRWELIEAIPRVSNAAPYTGDLCAHEVAFMKALPGKTYSVHWRYDLKGV